MIRSPRSIVSTAVSLALAASTLCACSDATLVVRDHDEDVAGSGGLELSGTMEGRSFTRRYEWTIAAIGRAGFDLHYRTLGDILLATGEHGDGDGLLEPGETLPGGGVLRMPAEGPSAGRHLCAGADSWFASADQEGGPVEFELRSLSDLGVCPGAPVAGGIDACLRKDGGPGTACPAGRHLTSSIDGLSFDWTDRVTGYRLHVRDEGSVGLRVRLTTSSVLLVDLEGDRVTGGLLWVSPEEQPAGAAYCIGAGRVDGDPTSGPFRLELGDASLLGACGEAPLSGSISGRL